MRVGQRVSGLRQRWATTVCVTVIALIILPGAPLPARKISLADEQSSAIQIPSLEPDRSVPDGNVDFPLQQDNEETLTTEDSSSNAEILAHDSNATSLEPQRWHCHVAPSGIGRSTSRLTAFPVGARTLISRSSVNASAGCGRACGSVRPCPILYDGQRQSARAHREALPPWRQRSARL